MRFAGTWTRYSNSAIAQLTSAAISQGCDFVFFKCPYYAKVIKTFEIVSRTMAVSILDMGANIARLPALSTRLFEWENSARSKNPFFRFGACLI